MQARERFAEVNRSALALRDSLRSKAPPPSGPLPTAAPTPRRPDPLPPVLLTAAETYLAGKYDETLRILEIPNGAPGRVSALVCLFRAAASYALYQSGTRRMARCWNARSRTCAPVAAAIRR